MRTIFRITLKIVLYFFLSTIAVVIIYRWVNPPLTYLMVKRYIEHSGENKPAILTKKWKRIEDISPNLIYAVVASEDAKFMQHNGLDLESMQKVMHSNKKGKRLKGASTISQQTAKNVFLWPARNYIRKGFEAYFTILIETLWGKKRIMEVYLNVIEMGRGIYGAEAASQKYFNKSAKSLTRREAALIASILPSPLKRNPKNPSNYMLKKQKWILANMIHLEKINFVEKKSKN